MSKSQSKGEALRRIVVALFNKTFKSTKITPQKGESEERYFLTPNKVFFRKIDTTIKDEKNYYLVIECKNVKRKPSLPDIASRLRDIKQDKKAKAGLMVISGCHISNKEIEDIHKKFDIFIWNDHLLSYYEKVSSSLREYAIYEILDSLKISIEGESEDKNIPAILIKQKVPYNKNIKFISFVAYPNQIIKKAFVFRHANKNPYSYQRLIKKKKLKSIAKYLKEERGSMVNSILVILPSACKFTPAILSKTEDSSWYYGESIKGTIGRINLPNKFSSIEIIDGQHRLYSFIYLEKNLWPNFPLHFIGIIGLKKKDIARELFMIINQSAKKIDANLLAQIYAEYDKNHLDKPESLAREIVRKLNLKKDCPIKDKILMGERVSSQDKALKIYLAMLAYYGIKPLINKEGQLRKFSKEKDIDIFVSIINEYLKQLKKTFSQEYSDIDKYFTFTNNGLIPLMKIFNNCCSFYKKIPNTKEISNILKCIKKYDWTFKYMKGRSSGSGWNKTYEELIDEIKKNPKFSNF